MSIEDQALHVLEQRCRYCGAQPGEFHDRHCNVILTQKMEDFISNLSYALNEVSRKTEEVAREINRMGETISQNESYHLFMRHTP